MKCPKCGSENVTVQALTESKLVDQHHGVLWWLLIGFWWVPVKWICFTGLALLVKIFTHKKQQLKQTTKSVCVCQNCGNHWNT